MNTMSPLERLRSRPVPTASYTFAYDPDDAVAVTEAQNKLQRLEQTAERNPDGKATRAAVKKARTELEQLTADLVTVTLTLKAVGLSVIEELQMQHPPTEAQRAHLGEGTTGVNPATYGPEAIAVSLVSLTFSDRPDEPVTEMSVEDAAMLWGTLGGMDQMEIMGMIATLNTRPSQVKSLGKG